MNGDVYVRAGDNETLISPLLGRMPQQLEVRGPEDDWTGVTDGAERRRLQNRLNQRAWRRRRRKQWRDDGPGNTPTNHGRLENTPGSENYSSGTTDSSLSTDPGAMNQSYEGAGSMSIGVSGPGNGRLPSTTRHLGLAEIQKMTFHFEELAYQEYTLGSPRVDLLLTLIQFNVFRAIIINNAALGFAMEWLHEDALSPFNTTSPESLPVSCPPHLRPTGLQRTVLHHPWIDMFPIPTMRDNLLRAGDSFDDDELCMDLVEFWSSPGERTGLVVWGDPWDARNWEVSEELLKKWAWVVRGCHELFRSTNHWRMKRGEKRLYSEPLDFCG